MDVIDQMIFVLWYTEYTTLGTAKEVLLNEMIEIAKRYGDDASSKLINGIGHKILSGIQPWNIVS
jgi:transcription termination factor NusB